MKFNMMLSKTDANSQRTQLEELFTTQKEGCCSIDTKSVYLCMQLFEKTFAPERCPNCREGVIETNHLVYYNRIIKFCNNCYCHFHIGQ